MKLTVVIPCLNEIKALPRMRERLTTFRNLLPSQDIITELEVLIVDDGSNDGTELVLPRWHDCRVIRNPKPTGYGAALKAGFQEATGDLIGFIDMDSSYVPEEFFPLCKQLVKSRSACIFGSRFQKNSEMPKLRRIGNQLYTRTLQAMCGSDLTDVCTGQRVFRREILPLALGLPQNDLSYSVALSVALLKSGLPLEEMKVAYLERDGESKLSVVSDGLGFLWAILRTRYGSNHGRDLD